MSAAGGRRARSATSNLLCYVMNSGREEASSTGLAVIPPVVPAAQDPPLPAPSPAYPPKPWCLFRKRSPPDLLDDAPVRPRGLPCPGSRFAGNVSPLCVPSLKFTSVVVARRWSLHGAREGGGARASRRCATALARPEAAGLAARRAGLRWRSVGPPAWPAARCVAQTRKFTCARTARLMERERTHAMSCVSSGRTHGRYATSRVRPSDGSPSQRSAPTVLRRRHL